MADASVPALAGALTRARGATLVLTGAGVSAASGIATFRGSSDSVWSRDVQEMATVSYFKANPAKSWQWYRARFSGLSQYLPNDAHRAIAAIEQWQLEAPEPGGLLVTQNIDTLHEQAGSKNLVKVHGSSDRVRCSEWECRGWSATTAIADIDFRRFDVEGNVAALPRCTICGALMRPHVLWFDETYDSHPEYRWQRIEAAGRTMRLVVAVGTSFSVGVTAFIQQQAARRRVPLVVVDPGEARAVAPDVVHVRGNAETVLPAVVALLRAGTGGGVGCQ